MMSIIKADITTKYDKGDVVVFKYRDCLMVGIITGYSVDAAAGVSIWYNIAINTKTTLDYTHGGDIMEDDILGKLDDCRLTIMASSFVKTGDVKTGEFVYPDNIANDLPLPGTEVRI